MLHQWRLDLPTITSQIRYSKYMNVDSATQWSHVCLPVLSVANSSGPGIPVEPAPPSFAPAELKFPSECNSHWSLDQKATEPLFINTGESPSVVVGIVHHNYKCTSSSAQERRYLVHPESRLGLFAELQVSISIIECRTIWVMGPWLPWFKGSIQSILLRFSVIERFKFKGNVPLNAVYVPLNAVPFNFKHVIQRHRAELRQYTFDILMN